MSQMIQSIKIKNGFTISYKQLTFKYPLEKSVLKRLQKEQFLSEVMFNLCEVNLSGQYFQKWTYTGKLWLSYAEFKQIKENTNVALIIANQLQKCQQSKNLNQFKVLNIPFAYLYQSSKWETASLNVIRKDNLNLLKSIQCVQFPKLLTLQLVGNNLTSIQPLQTLQLSNLQSLHLRANQIAFIKSIQKLNCKNLKFLDLSANFLNSDKTFEGLTKLNAQKLNKIYLHCQHNKDIHQKLNNLDLTQLHRRQIKNKKYNPSNQALQVTYVINNQIQVKSKKQFDLNRNYARLFNSRSRSKFPFQMIDYLISETLRFSQFKFLLKSNSCYDQLFNPKAIRHATSPYHYFIFYSTDVYKCVQIYQEHLFQEYQMFYEGQYDHYYQNYWQYQQYEHILDLNERDYNYLVVNKKGYLYI